MIETLLSTCFIFYISLWLGNFLTSFYFRIPRNIPINGILNPPMCSNCGVKLQYPDYGPVIHHLFCGGKCKHCGFIVPSKYFWIEVSTAIILTALFITNGITDDIIAKAMLVTVMILVFLINKEHQQVHEKTLWIFAIIAIIYRSISTLPGEDIMLSILYPLLLGFIYRMTILKNELKTTGYMVFFALNSLIFPTVAFFIIAVILKLAHKISKTFDTVSFLTVLSIVYLMCEKTLRLKDSMENLKYYVLWKSFSLFS